MKTRVVIIGSGNIGTDLMFKILRRSQRLELAAVVGIDPQSEGLALARDQNIVTISDGVEGLVESPSFKGVEIIFDATSAAAHKHNVAVLASHPVRIIDLTPAAMGPLVIPSVNLGAYPDAREVNMVTCGGQATIPIVAAMTAQTVVPYCEIVASIASKSAGPGTRANIDEFTETTSAALRSVGGAARGRALIILNPADPPVMMRDTVTAVIGPDDHEAVKAAIEQAVQRVQRYVPGYRLKQAVQIQPLGDTDLRSLELDSFGQDITHRISVFLEVEGGGDYLPPFAGNLDIMTSAALEVGESWANAGWGTEEAS
ncbi:acetaldehyde dehydrogenase (acetylating) [Kocuria sp.]|uniref:acetaldehyde dehydrogenase (acetylating) n=1 Tax=Kocuria sp. TaxID=1871328 RepID=UPI0026DF5A6A|nr:acetaldehyde dehydrogenase (acetylating) [Kocuria sp.]MDO5619482.1 acetaldehyde dehydrogenase (acetylating) [Kocuria sp.]